MRHRSWIFFYTIIFVLFVYTGLKLTQIFRGRKAAAAVTALALFAVMLSGQILYRRNPSVEAGPFEILFWTGSVLMGLWATFILLSIPFDIANLVWLAFDKITGAPRGRGASGPADFSRRQLLTAWLPLGIAGASGLMTSIGLGQAMAGPQVKRVTIPLENWPAGFAGLTIAQISDIHASPLIGREYLQHIADLVAPLQADVIVLTGDIADGTPQDLSDQVAPLGALAAPLGKFYITGNHEYYWGAEQWVEKARELGFEPLMNESRVLNKNGATFVIGGVTDTDAHQFDAEQKSDPVRALAANAQVAGAPRILLAHRPESCVAAEKAGWHVQLSGHTHGGQFFPFNLLMPLAHRFYKGLHRHESMWLYVNRGTGYWGPPNRFANRSEITLLSFERPT